MATISLTRTTQPSTSNADANLNNNWTALENLLNGNIDNTNVKAAAGIVPSKIGQSGATTDQALIWNGSAWAPLSVVRPTLVDAKGDVLVGTANDTLARQAVGANNTLLVADSAQTNGLKWGQVVNAGVASAAAIDVSKLAAGSSSRQVLGMVGGVPTWIDGPTWLTNTSPVGTGASAAEVDLQTVTISANALTTGDIVRIEAGGTMTRSSGNEIMRLYFGTSGGSGGGGMICASQAEAFTGTWHFEAVIVVTGTNSQKTVATLWASNNSSTLDVQPFVTTCTSAISGSIVVKTTGNTSSGADEVTSELLAVEIVPA